MENHSPDWRAIRRAFIRKTKSNRQLAREHGVTEGAIRRRAKAENWGPENTQNTHPRLAVIEGGGGAPGGGGTPEPDWSLIYVDELQISRAQAYWRDLITDLRDSEKLATANLHAVKRLVIAYVLVDQAIEKVAEQNPVITGKRGGQIANPWMDSLKDANNMASALEAELTITPRRRNSGGKVQKKRAAASGAANYLHAVPGRK